MKEKFDAEPVLQKLAEMRKSIPHLDQSRRQRSEDGRVGAVEGIEPRTAEEFEYAAVAEALDSLASDLREAIDRKTAEATAKALEVYYAAEELARDPAHADLIPHVEEMRRAYERSYGKPIPPNPKR